MRASAASTSRRALAAPGVVAAITAADIPGKNDIAPIRTDEPLLAADLVEHEGQPVAAVAAATLDQARAAAKLVTVEYEPLPAVLTVEEAVARESSSRRRRTWIRGDIDGRADVGAASPRPANSAAAARITSISKARSRIATPGDDGDYPRLLARPSIRPRCSTASPMCSACRSTPSRSRCAAWAAASAARKARPTIIAGIAAVLAWKTRRPVKLRLPRDDDMRATGKRHPFLFRYEVGFDDDGAHPRRST